jgi:hypothetical protein
VAQGFSPVTPSAAAQSFSYRGFIEARADLYPQEASNDETQAIGEAVFRIEASGDGWPWLRLRGGFDARMDTNGQVARSWEIDWLDRTRQRPALAVREANATIGRGRATLDIGKQFIRWGKADIVNPTDRFAPRDFLAVTDNVFLAVTGARLAYGGASRTIEAVWVPALTPSRIPLYDRRWTVLLPPLQNLQLVDLGADYPEGSQVGVRWNHVASGYEYSISYFDGYNNLPLIDATVFPTFAPPPAAGLEQRFPRIREAGGDLAWPLPWFTLKGEAAYFTSPQDDADEYVLYVIQAERQWGETSLVAGYAGEAVTIQRRNAGFAPDRGLTKAVLGRLSYTIDPNRSVAAEFAVRQNLDGAWLKGEYSQAVGGHWRVTVLGNLIGGEATDFIGQYRRNSHVTMTVRCSF